MDFKVKLAELRMAVARVIGTVEKKTTMPVLANMKLVADKAGTISITGFDLDIGVISTHPAEVAKAGAVTIQGKILEDVVERMVGEEIHLRRLANNYVEIISGPTTFKIVGMAAEEYPALPKPEASTFSKVSGPALLEMFRRVSFAISSDETRYILNGIFLEALKGNKVRGVATDGHRLSVSDHELPEPLALPKELKAGVILPRKAVLVLRRIIEEAPEAGGEWAFHENMVLFRKDGLTFIGRLIDGQFPEYQRVIPKELGKSVRVPREGFINMLKRVALLSADKSNAIRLELKEGQLVITSNNPDLGDAKDMMEVPYTGDSVSIGFNARYLTDVLGALPTEDVLLEMGDEASPAVIRPPEGDAFSAVVMPMRV